MEKTEDDLLVERACGITGVSKFRFFAKAFAWDRGAPNTQKAATDYNTYEQSEEYPAYVLGYAGCVVRNEEAKPPPDPPFTNVRSIHTKLDGVADLNRYRNKRKPGEPR